MSEQPKFPWLASAVMLVIICGILYVLLLT